MSILRKALSALTMAAACTAAHDAGAKPAAAAAAEAAVSADAQAVASWALQNRDTGAKPFAVVDKKAARAYVFTAEGKLAGATPVLLGAAPGDRGKPGLGKLAPAQIPRAERKTPSGRFESFPGENLDGEDVVWFDYDEGLAIHRLRPGTTQAARLQRIDAAEASAHRVSAGCIVVPTAFYERIVRPLLGRGKAILYVLPEQGSVAAFLAALDSD